MRRGAGIGALKKQAATLKHYNKLGAQIEEDDNAAVRSFDNICNG